MKKIIFFGDSLDILRGYPESVKDDMGYQLDRVEQGLMPTDWKPMTSVGSGVKEIRVRVQSGAYRTIYFVEKSDQVYVLHIFQKKTQKTSKKDIDIAKDRYKQLNRKGVWR